MMKHIAAVGLALMLATALLASTGTGIAATFSGCTGSCDGTVDAAGKYHSSMSDDCGGSSGCGCKVNSSNKADCKQ